MDPGATYDRAFSGRRPKFAPDATSVRADRTSSAIAGRRDTLLIEET
jgi:hypothetical protein